MWSGFPASYADSSAYLCVVRNSTVGISKKALDFQCFWLLRTLDGARDSTRAHTGRAHVPPHCLTLYHNANALNVRSPNPLGSAV